MTAVRQLDPREFSDPPEPRSLPCPACQNKGFIPCECECGDTHEKTCPMCVRGWITQQEADKYAAEQLQAEVNAKSEAVDEDEIPW